MTTVTRLCLFAGEAALRGEPRLQTLPVASALTAHRTGPPPISPSKRKFSVDPGDDDLDCDGDHASKMSRTFAPTCKCPPTLPPARLTWARGELLRPLCADSEGRRCLLVPPAPRLEGPFNWF